MKYLIICIYFSRRVTSLSEVANTCLHSRYLPGECKWICFSISMSYEWSWLFLTAFHTALWVCQFFIPNIYFFPTCSTAQDPHFVEWALDGLSRYGCNCGTWVGWAAPGIWFFLFAASAICFLPKVTHNVFGFIPGRRTSLQCWIHLYFCHSRQINNLVFGSCSLYFYNCLQVQRI